MPDPESKTKLVIKEQTDPLSQNYLPHSIPVTSADSNKDMSLKNRLQVGNCVCQLVFQWLHPTLNIRFNHRFL